MWHLFAVYAPYIPKCNTLHTKCISRTAPHRTQKSHLHNFIRGFLFALVSRYILPSLSLSHRACPISFRFCFIFSCCHHHQFCCFFFTLRPFYCCCCATFFLSPVIWYHPQRHYCIVQSITFLPLQNVQGFLLFLRLFKQTKLTLRAYGFLDLTAEENE